MMTGGEFKPPTLSLTGQKAADFLADIHVDKLFLATAGISLKAGLTYPSISDLVVKKAMIDAAEIIYLVADSTKIRKPSFASLGALSLIDYIITDPSIREEHKNFLKHMTSNLSLHKPVSVYIEFILARYVLPIKYNAFCVYLRFFVYFVNFVSYRVMDPKFILAIDQSTSATKGNAVQPQS